MSYKNRGRSIAKPLWVSRSQQQRQTMTITTRKHWEIFLAFIIALITVRIITDTILGYLGIRLFDKVYRATNFLTTLSLYFSYPMLVGQDLKLRLSRQNKFKPTSVLSLIIPIIVLIINAFFGLYLDKPTILTLLIIAVVNLFCMLRVVSFPARQLKSIELKRNAGIWEYAPETFQFLCWPLGLWWTQPTINRLVTKEIIIEE